MSSSYAFHPCHSILLFPLSAPGKKPGRHVLHPPGCILVKTETSCCGGQGRSLPRLPACLWFLRICFCSFCRSPLQSHHPSSSVFKSRLENSLIHLPRHPRADTRAPAGTRLPSARRHMDRPSRSAKCEPRDERCGWEFGGGGHKQDSGEATTKGKIQDTGR